MYCIQFECHKWNFNFVRIIRLIMITWNRLEFTASTKNNNMYHTFRGLMFLTVSDSRHSWWFLLREWEINPREKIQDPAGIRTQDLLNTSQTLVLSCITPLGPLAEEWRTSLEASAKFQLILTQKVLGSKLSQLDPGFLFRGFISHSLNQKHHSWALTVVTSK